MIRHQMIDNYYKTVQKQEEQISKANKITSSTTHRLTDVRVIANLKND